MDSGRIVDEIQKQKWVSPLAEKLANGTTAVFQSAGDISQPIKNFLNGAFLGHPLHPVMTDIPLGAWSVAAILDAADALGIEGTAGGADAAVVIGIVGALGSAVTGLADWHDVDEDKPKNVGAIHAILNVTALALYGSSYLLRRKKHRTAARILAATGYGLVGLSAYLGGILVFDLKVGVDHAQRDNFPKDWTQVASVMDLQDSIPSCAKVGEVELLLVKQGDHVVALGNLCSHAGGPLCEGKVENGTITCPWHGSRFDLVTGAVIDGPATSGQPIFQARIVDGNVEVKAQSPS